MTKISRSAYAEMFGPTTGDRIRLANEGEAGEHGAPAGDLYVQMHVKPHDIFVRDDNNLQCEMPISIGTMKWQRRSRKSPTWIWISISRSWTCPFALA